MEGEREGRDGVGLDKHTYVYTTLLNLFSLSLSLCLSPSHSVSLVPSGMLGQLRRLIHRSNKYIRKDVHLAPIQKER